MKKKVFLIGLNLYSIFLSLKIRSDFKEFDITILEGSNNFLKAYNHLKIGKYLVNPGFHTFEDVRSKSLLDFLKKNIKFKKLKKTRGMIIGKNLISCQDTYDNWPNEIKKKFKLNGKNFIYKNKKENLNHIDKRYLSYLKDCFSDSRTSFNDAIDLSYPWFFPPNYKHAYILRYAIYVPNHRIFFYIMDTIFLYLSCLWVKIVIYRSILPKLLFTCFCLF